MCLRRRTHDENHLRELNDSGPDAHSVESVDLKRRTSVYLDRKGVVGGGRNAKKTLSDAGRRRGRRQARLQPRKETTTCRRVWARCIDVSVAGNLRFAGPTSKPANDRHGDMHRVGRRGGARTYAMQRPLTTRGWADVQACERV